MGEYTSATTFDGYMFKQKLVGGSEYESSVWTPTVFTFDINPNNLTLENIQIVSLGTPTPYLENYDGKQQTPNVKLSTSVSSSSFMRVYKTSRWPGIYENKYIEFYPDEDVVSISYNSHDVYIGAYYNPDVDGVWVISYYDGGYINYSSIISKSDKPSAYNFIVNRFYNPSVVGSKIVRKSPESLEFNSGQTSQLVYQLVAADIPIDVNMMIIPGDVVGLANGWSFDSSVSPPTLSLSSSRYRQSIKVSCEYDGLTYSLTDVFYPSGYSPYSPGGTAGPSGGGGNFGSGEESDTIVIPGGTSAADASDTGLYTRYLMNSSDLDFVGQWLWTDNLGLTIAKAFVSLLYGNPAESLISLMSYPFAIDSMGIQTTARNLCWGGHNSGITAQVLGSSALSVSWGSIEIKEYWGNFLDYEPHTKIELYLPWGTGFVSIDPGQVMGGSISVTTNIDLNKGSCVHSVFAGGSLIGSYAGQCGQQIPLVSNDYASKVAGVVVAGTALAVNGISGIAAASAGTNAEIAYRKYHPFHPNTKSSDTVIKSLDARQRGISNAIQEAEAPHRAIQRRAGHLASAASLAATKRSGIIARSGSFTDGSAGLGCQYPYIILSRPSQSVPAKYGHHYGYPSNIYLKLGDLKGYTEVGEIHLNGIPATDVELDELDAILKGGVMF